MRRQQLEAAAPAQRRILHPDERGQQLECLVQRASLMMGPEQAVHRLFAAQAVRSPDAEAVVGGGASLSYRELDHRSNEIAAQLRRARVGPDVVVGLCTERSIDMVAALLGILKAGGAYLYLDPQHPRERLAFMCQDTHTKVVLASAAARAAIQNEIAAQWLPIEASFEDDGARVPVSPSDLAYVVYTSGSTGRPKGVAIEHRALSYLTRALVDAFDVRATDRVLQFASPSWDTMVEEVFPTLVVGGTLILRGADMIESKALIAGCAANRVTIVDLPTAIWHRLTSALEEDELALPVTLRTVVIGGEPASPDRVAAWHAHARPDIRLVNSYGLSEAAAVCTIAELTRTEPEIVIGLPLPHVEVTIRNARLEPVSIDVIGEICIGGEGLARGYVNRPEDTASRFVHVGGQRIYRSGDSGYRRADGQFVCTGRLDDQIKVGGVRIEPGEIEAVFRRHRGVAEVAVRVHATGVDKHLVAHVVLRDSSNHRDILEHVRAHLPPAMVPEIMLYGALPLTASGKIDREKLRYEEPVEAALCSLASAVLGGNGLGPADDFFEAGGNSLRASSFIIRARRELGLDISFEQMLRARTMGAIASVTTRVRGRESSRIEPCKPEQAGTPSLAQEWYWRIGQHTFHSSAAATAYNMSWVLHIRGPLDPNVVESVMTALTMRHETLRTVFAEDTQAGLRARVLPSPRVTLRRIDWAEHRATSDDVTAFAERDAGMAFDLSGALPFRATLIDRGDSVYALVLCIHHIAVDGWSFGILAREAAIAHRAFQRGEEPCFPPLPIVYSDYAVWERAFATSDAAKAQLAYWRRHLHDAPAIVALPFDRPRPLERAFRGGRIRRVWSGGAWSSVRRLSREQGATPFMILLAMFAASLSGWSGQTDVVIGTPVSGRNRPELEPLVGFFPNTIALRIDLSEEPTFAELVRRVRTVCLGGFANADVSIDQVMAALDVTRLYSVMLTLQHEAIDRPVFEGLELEVEELEQVTGFHDLLLDVEEQGDGAILVWEYNLDIFDGPTVHRMANDFDIRAMRRLETNEPGESP
ncbi:amino acid adenylation domain-containing protein [Pendulispora brunnea]|uniref:Amino acid adenylation domain-containing protein n=1 Tax=Pendulispora brunnea TaxID=2905690 RepID=A0ABZ2KCD9_9BACT